jgi:hypothetical protein
MIGEKSKAIPFIEQSPYHRLVDTREAVCRVIDIHMKGGITSRISVAET